MTKVQLGKLLLIPAVLGFVFGIVIPFVRGGSSGGYTGLIPLNTQMQAALVEQTGTAGQKAANETRTAASPAAGALKPAGEARSEAEHGATPAAQEKAPPPTSPASASPSIQPSPQSIAQSTLLDLNTATLEQLDSLPGVGPSKAKAIQDYRNQKGKFKRLEELKEVKGIGDKIFEKLRPYLYVADS
ncbi:helix-hairpin-helix domain-containing protein [Paenibacillus oryzisoli]|uniref:ComEA family DNA-binding protein n=1 Tax=Paenibacillus oryzisoli TaxID=1850517 RepID=UPI003D2C9312